MRRLLTILAGAVAVTAIATAAAATTVQVSIRDNGFSPKHVTVTAGDTVRWTNNGQQNHQVVSTTGAFASPVLRPGQSYSFRFTGAGSHTYRDALNPTRTGTVTVKAPPPPPAGVSITESQPIVIAGQAFRLSGAVSTGQQNQTIEVYHKPYPQTSFALLATVKTVAGGYWDYVVTPTVLSNYYVRWVEKKVNSSTDMIQVRPRMSIAYSRLTKKFTARVFGIEPKPGRFVYLQRLTKLGQWVNFKKVTLGAANSATFTSKLPVGAFRYRMFITVNQAGAGYLASWSGTLLIGIKPPA
jgi:plastocyanin